MCNKVDLCHHFNTKKLFSLNNIECQNLETIFFIVETFTNTSSDLSIMYLLKFKIYYMSLFYTWVLTSELTTFLNSQSKKSFLNIKCPFKTF